MKVNIPKSETPKFVSNAKNRISKSMGKVLSLIPVSLLVGGAIVVSFLFATGCKKGTNCPDGYDHSIMKSPPKYAMADDPCEEERNAVEVGMQDSIQSAQNVRDAIWPALNEPQNISDYYWLTFKHFPRPKDDFLDSVNSHISTTTNILEWFPEYNALTLKALQDSCYVYLNKVEDMKIKRDALEDCESNVGITEYEWVKDDCGGYWTIK